MQIATAIHATCNDIDSFTNVETEIITEVVLAKLEKKLAR
jgi:hypothetical protein